MHECTKGIVDTNAEKLAAAFEANEIHVLDAEMYGGGALHLLCTPTAQSNGFPVHILRVDVCGNLRKIEAVNAAHVLRRPAAADGAPGRAVGVLFERKFETVKWFELEAPAESRSLLSKAVLATPREREMSALSDLTPRKTPAGFRAQTPPASSTGRPAPYSRPSAQRRRRVPPATAQRLSFTLPASQTTPATTGTSTATRAAPRRSTRRRFTAELVISDGAEASTTSEQPPAADLNDNELPNAQWESEQMRAMLENLDAQTEAAARAIATVISANSDPIDRPIPTHIPPADRRLGQQRADGRHARADLRSSEEAGPPPITPARTRRPDESDDERDVQDIVDSFFDPDSH
ncbi:hypothetical protein M3Y99_01838800 [Aphelenchoides fujianensis]|nr:hypothetical protein M3Y99_01838800 [Aphelenchoides fujianensis]